MAFKISFLTLSLMPWPVMALFSPTNETEFWDEFTNNFATDLAPIIALFGEQVTKQFLSESTTLLDAIVFAVGPLGIITAIVSCIRVAGGSFLKSIVGRAREPHGLPEVELCSSTSENVCELWSNGGICRVFGRPKIIEFIYHKPKDFSAYYPSYNSSGTEIPAICGIMSTRQFFCNLDSESSTIEKNDSPQWVAISSHQILWIPFRCIISRLQNITGHAEARAIPGTQSDDIEGGTINNAPLTSISLSGSSSGSVITTSSLRSQEVPNLAPEESGTGTENQLEKATMQRQRKRQMENDIGEINCPKGDDFAPFPNLALNIGVQPALVSILGLWVAAAFGVLVQASFFIYAIWATQYNESFYEADRIPKDPLFFIFAIAGTLCITIGMALSAHIIDGTSRERRFAFRVSRVGSEKPRMFWLQPGRQRIGDQEFDGFAHNQIKTEYIASWKHNTGKSAYKWRVWLAIGFSVIGWTTQFIGLRGVHGTVSLFQLCVTLIMSMVRAVLRSYRKSPSNRLQPTKKWTQTADDHNEGHELDWQAMELTNIHEYISKDKQVRFWFIVDRDHNDQTNVDQEIATTALFSDEGDFAFQWISPASNLTLINDSRDNTLRAISFVRWLNTRGFQYWRETGPNDVRKDALDVKDYLKSVHDLPRRATRALRFRSRLSFLTNQPPYQVWDSDVRDVARRLRSALQKAGGLLMTAKPKWLSLSLEFDADSIIWSTACQLSKEWSLQRNSTAEVPMWFHMYRRGKTWTIDEHQLEAILGLWLYSFQRWQSQFKDNVAVPVNIKPLAVHPVANEFLSLLLRRRGLQYQNSPIKCPIEEISNLSVSTFMSLKSPAHISKPEAAANVLYIDATSPILSLMAQDIFTVFLKRIGLALNDNFLTDALFPNVRVSTGHQISLVDDLVEVLVSESLATPNEATMTVIPGLCRPGVPKA